MQHCPREQATFLRPKGLAGVEALHATFLRHRYAPHVHDAWTVAQVIAGAARFQLEGRWHTAAAGSVFIIPPDAVHTGESATAGGYTYRVLYLQHEALRDWLDHELWAKGELPVVVRSRQLSRALSVSHAVLLQQQVLLEQGEALASVSRQLYNALRHTTVDPQPSRRPHPAVQSARGYIQDRWKQDFTLGELASAVGMSPFHLVRTFRSHVGVTPSAYRRAVRVKAAQRFLRSGVPPAQAALDAGFYDQAHLNRYFKRATGVTPGQYAAAHAGRSTGREAPTSPSMTQRPSHR
jgi:AraC-like DNA-binding protein